MGFFFVVPWSTISILEIPHFFQSSLGFKIFSSDYFISLEGHLYAHRYILDALFYQCLCPLRSYIINNTNYYKYLLLDEE